MSILPTFYAWIYTIKKAKTLPIPSYLFTIFNWDSLQGFTEQSIRSMELQGKEAQKDLKHTGNLTVKSCLLILDLKPLRS